MLRCLRWGVRRWSSMEMLDVVLERVGASLEWRGEAYLNKIVEAKEHQRRRLEVFRRIETQCVRVVLMKLFSQ